VPDNGLVGYMPRDLVVRSATPPESLVADVRRIVQRADPRQPLSDVQLLEDLVAADTAPRRVQATLLIVFAALATLLAAIGIHGLLAQAVSVRAREIGVRRALGATARDVLALVGRSTARAAGLGLLAGLVLARIAASGLASLLAGIPASDVAAWVTAAAACVGAALLGAAWPALRAARVDPLIALRAE
jgi:ABC-type antimicrobial peptide transport system permease subunit